MSDTVFYYYAPEWAIILFLSLFTAGLICGYMLWATKRDAALAIETECDDLRSSLQEMKNVKLKLDSQIRMTE